jgi:hypothetical protein
MINLIVEVFKVFAKHNLFNEGIELVGSWCFQLYQKHLDAKAFPLKTQDIDFLVPSPYRGKEHKDFIKDLEALGFQCDFYGDGSLYLWNAELKIEFITNEKSCGTPNSVKIKQLGINAIPLRFVSLLLDEPITLVEKRIKILVPNPAHFCLHKLIIASRRRKIDKSLKDLQQAICTSVIVSDQKLQELFGSLPKKWRQTIIRTLVKGSQEIPLLEAETNKLLLTLQNIKTL